MNKSNKTPVCNLLKAGLEEAKKVQEIKSVAEQAVASTPYSNQQSTVEEIPDVEDNNKPSQESTKEIHKKGIEYIFTDRKINNTEGVRIPAEFHKELKILAGLSGCTIVQMLGNILEDFLNENQKAISSYKRKMI